MQTQELYFAVGAIISVGITCYLVWTRKRELTSVESIIFSLVFPFSSVWFVLRFVEAKKPEEISPVYHDNAAVLAGVCIGLCISTIVVKLHKLNKSNVGRTSSSKE